MELTLDELQRVSEMLWDRLGSHVDNTTQVAVHTVMANRVRSFQATNLDGTDVATLFDVLAAISPSHKPGEMLSAAQRVSNVSRAFCDHLVQHSVNQAPHDSPHVVSDHIDAASVHAVHTQDRRNFFLSIGVLPPALHDPSFVAQHENGNTTATQHTLSIVTDASIASAIACQDIANEYTGQCADVAQIQVPVSGCTYRLATNYNPLATVEDYTCSFSAVCSCRCI